MTTTTIEKPWIDEASRVTCDCIRYGFALENKSLGQIFMQELGLNQRYPSPRGQSRKDEVLDTVKGLLCKNGYQLRWGLWKPAKYIDTLTTLQQFPENIPAANLWDQLKNYSRGEAYVSCNEDLTKISDLLIGQDVIEIGPGYGKLVKKVFEFGGKSYIGVDPFYGISIPIKELEEAKKIKEGQAKCVKSDGLTFLLDQPDNSGVILSFNVFCEEILRSANIFYATQAMHERQKVFRDRYWNELTKQVHRVTKPNGFVFHSYGYDPDLFDEKYLRLGFEKDKKFRGLFWKK